ncbi:BglG family transcription antiterminator [Alkalibaculum bacchi]|uniref:BglG family transcription antiterminator n=1 Tax=Alkalibaculum bacchi TaxID=645887 RepID=UPI0026EB005C|nr:BglG family transcription antiterminator [Alkalibaculum bacchi]
MRCCIINKQIDSRVEKLLQILFSKEDGAITINQLASKLSVSNRTVRNDLDKLETYLNTLQGEIKIIKKPRIGIWFEYDEQGRQSLEKLVNYRSIYLEPYSSEERQRFIIKKLIQSFHPVSLQSLADNLIVSRVTISKDLEAVDKRLEKYNLSLVKKKNQGISIDGDEKNWRKAASDLIAQIKEEQELKDILMKSDDPIGNNRLNIQDSNNIKDLIPQIELTKIEKIITEAESQLSSPLSDEAFTGLVIHIAISIERLKQKKDIKMPSNNLEDIKKKKEYPVAAWIGMRLEKEIHIKIPESEIAYIALHIIGAKPMEVIDIGNNKESILNDIDSSILDATKEIIGLVANILSVPLSDDKSLLIGLSLHLKTAVNRLKYGLSLRNPLLDQIKEKYPSVFGACWATSIIFERRFNIQITEEEIGYIAIHIGAALERSKSNYRAIVVCSTGVGTSQLVVSRLKNRIKNIEIIGVSSLHELTSYEQNKYDIIISTIPIPEKDKPVVSISVFVDENDISLILQKINDLSSEKRDNNKYSISSLLNKKFIFLQESFSSRIEVIKEIGDMLNKEGYVTEEFTISALSREKLTSTAVGNGVAIPHGKDTYVNRPIIAVIILNEPIDWGGYPVDIIFYLALHFENSKETKNFFKKFHGLVDNQNQLITIRNTKNIDVLYQILIDL